ncbi:hypothetical protein H9655_08825 [Cytobacillus sp. Sa5YUA1]|uniref:Uncharacterized protein n=1 Tax=Cytobacillus stercorigallinarum TaxID=2762240 RepID=A0ABR8QNQ9_9BACI|nr:hypothetical protein [Cytobacillus stercorigallinarum]MBD7937133.1 hypothetical protein [Cytobacillus stercorigallinarum]
MNMIKKMYKNLLKNGWTLNQIDEMDIHFYFSLEGADQEETFIDEIKLF